MAKINVVHLVGGGLLAGLIYNVIGGVVWEMILHDEFVRQLGRELPKRAIPAAMALGYLIGIMAVWLYASMRAHYGPGPKTAVIAAVVTWMLCFALPHYSFWAAGIFAGSFMALASAIALAELILATLVGAWIYKPVGEAALPEPG